LTPQSTAGEHHHLQVPDIVGLRKRKGLALAEVEFLASLRADG
jgi:hypothetical protein